MNDLGINHNPTPPSTTPRWMMSFADLMSVVLTFFVLLFSLSTPPTPKKDVIENELTKTDMAAFSVNKSDVDTNFKTATTDQDLSTNYLADIIKNKITTNPELAKAELKHSDDKLTISIGATSFNDAYAKDIVGILKPLENRAVVYSANLDQSRAVMRKLHEFGVEKNISFFESKDYSGKIDIVIYP